MKYNHVTLNMPNINSIENQIKQALLEAADAVKTDVQQSQTMPFDTGNLQNRSTFVDDSRIDKYEAAVGSYTPYARRLYFHPEYNYQTKDNPKAGGAWFEPYISGEKKDYAQKVFASFLRGGI